MKIDVISVSLSDGQAGLRERFAALEPQPDFAAIQYNCAFDLADWLSEQSAPQLIGATSALGSMSVDGPIDGAVLFCISDPSGDYGVGSQPLGDSPEQAARQATIDALNKADRMGERPALVWVVTTPGHEEAVLAGIEGIVSADVPILGGSAADNDVTGQWSVLASQIHGEPAVAVAVLFPSGPVQHAYQNGYAPTARSGLVTKVEGRRLLELDGRRAIDVYREWTDNAVTDAPAAGAEPAPILAESTLWPLGRETSSVNGIPQYLLAHPSAVDSDGALHLFADVHEGERLVQMSGSIDGLTSRAGRVAKLAARAGDIAPDQVAGALMVYCGGCMFAVQDNINDVVESVTDALPDVPFAGYFSFGEQGPVVGGTNRHGNLMISCVVFGHPD